MTATAPAPIHVVPPGAGEHLASDRCACSPIASFVDLASGARVYRHRCPPARPAGAMTPVLEAALAAWRDGARTPAAVADRLGIGATAARDRLAALADLGLLEEPRMG